MHETVKADKYEFDEIDGAWHCRKNTARR